MNDCRRTDGVKPRVVLLHGLMGSGATWALLARALGGEYEVVAPDARGHGEAGTPARGVRYEDLARDVEALARTLEGPVLVGHSMGGMTAAMVASRREVRLRGLVLVDPTFLSPARERELRESDVAEQHRKLLGRSKEELVAQARARSPQRSIEVLELQAEARLKTRMEAFDILAPPFPDYRAVVRAIEVPTLLVIGDEPVVTMAMAIELRGLNASVRVAQIADAGHGLPFDQPERLAEVVGSFLRELA